MISGLDHAFPVRIFYFCQCPPPVIPSFVASLSLSFFYPLFFYPLLFPSLLSFPSLPSPLFIPHTPLPLLVSSTSTSSLFLFNILFTLDSTRDPTTMGKKAIQFGGGNIGRGFIAGFIHEADYEVVFIDVMDNVITALQNAPSYEITEVSEEGETKKTITNYRAINSKTHEEDVVKEVSTADIVTCAVGPNVLKLIAPVIAKGIDARTSVKPVAVIACENAIGATDTLHAFIREHTSSERVTTLGKRAQFANAAIDRIVPNQPPDNGLNVRIEKFYEWVVEKGPFGKIGPPDINAIHWVDNLEPYIERKLFTVNTGHATAAYYGYAAGKKMVADALADDEIRTAVRNVLDETAALIVAKHGISQKEQTDYVEAIINRISNPSLEDSIVRVGRAPMRKVSRNERFICPASQIAERGAKYDALLGALDKALRFQDVEGDDESAELAKVLKELTAEEATTKLTGLERDHTLYNEVVRVVSKVQQSSK